MASANSTMPNTFLRMAIPPTPSNFSSRLIYFKTKYTITTFIKMAIIIEIKFYSALIESNVVRVPVPAIKGKAKGPNESGAGNSSL